jgi:hypothetical protein
MSAPKGGLTSILSKGQEVKPGTSYAVQAEQINVWAIPMLDIPFYTGCLNALCRFAGSLVMTPSHWLHPEYSGRLKKLPLGEQTDTFSIELAARCRL